MATMTPADATLQVRTFRRSPLSRARGHVGALWRRPLSQAIAKAVLTIYVTSTITFFLIRLMPGSPVELKIDELMPTGFSPAFIGDLFFHAALPISVFFLTHIGLWILSMRSATLAALEEDHVTVARARGLSDGRITTAYVGRNAVLPLVSQFAIAAGAVVGGAVIIEQIFVYQGVGLALVKAVDQRDYPVMQGIILMTTVAVIVANLVADLLYSRLDPRIGRAGGATGK